MGIPSGGSFGGSSGDGGFSSGGRFDFNDFSSHHDHRHGNRDSYNDPFYYNNQQRPYRESLGGSGGGDGGGGDGCARPCSIIVSFFTFVGSFWIIFGLFKSDQLLMSLNYSRLISANSVFVKQIEIRNLRDSGPVIYSFSERPALRDSILYNETHDDFVQSMFHKEWRFYLNEGSTIRVTYDMKGFGQDYLVLAFIRGTAGLDDWTRAPESGAKALKWYRIHGNGVKDFVVDRDDEYFIAFGNLNRGDMQITTEFSIHSTLYSVKGADKSTTLTSDVEAVTLPISLFHGDYHLLTTPSESQEGADIWEVAVIYSARWITFFIIWGTIVFALVLFCGIEFGRGRRSREELPLLAPRDDQGIPAPARNDLPSVAVSTPPGESAPHGESARDDQQLCTICLDAPKDCFFDPCGHRCTCYSCGRRIQGGNTATCPICRQPIKAVRKIFDS